MAKTKLVDITVFDNAGKNIQYKLESDLDGKVTLGGLLKFTKGALQAIALETFKEEKARGFDPEPIILVDGQRGKSIEDVSPFGKIEFISRQEIQDILLPIYREIISRSRVDTGLYKRSNIVAINGAVVAENESELQAYLKNNPDLKQGTLVRFFNIVPYARKLELTGISQGKSGAISKGRFRTRTTRKSKNHRPRKITVRAPNGTYYLTASVIKRKYGKNASIKFEFLPGNYLGIEKYPIRSPHTGKVMRRTFSEKRRSGGGRPYVYPTIVVKIDKAGTKETLP